MPLITIYIKHLYPNTISCICEREEVHFEYFGHFADLKEACPNTVSSGEDAISYRELQADGRRTSSDSGGILSPSKVRRDSSHRFSSRSGYKKFEMHPTPIYLYLAAQSQTNIEFIVDFSKQFNISLRSQSLPDQTIKPPADEEAALILKHSLLCRTSNRESQRRSFSFRGLPSGNELVHTLENKPFENNPHSMYRWFSAINQRSIIAQLAAIAYQR